MNRIEVRLSVFPGAVTYIVEEGECCGPGFACLNQIKSRSGIRVAVVLVINEKLVGGDPEYGNCGKVFATRTWDRLCLLEIGLVLG